jgi:integrase
MAKSCLLTPSQVKNAKPDAGAYKLRDGGGLYLLVRKTGAKWWRYDYRRPHTGKRNTLSMGTYPDVSLKKARDRHRQARELLADGIDPGAQRAATKQADADSFEAVAREWFAKQAPGWAESHSSKIIRRLECDVFPWIGDKPIGRLNAPDILAVLRRIESRGVIETAHRAKQSIGQVFRYAVATGRAQGDPTAALRGALAPTNPKHMAAITDPAKIGPFLRTIDGYRGTFVVKSALRLAPLVFARPGELRKAEWADIDLDAAEWRFLASKQRKGNESMTHIVPLSRQAVAILRDLEPMTRRGFYVFPGARSQARPMSENTVNAAFRRMGIAKDEMTAHGFRAMARTLLSEQGWKSDAIERQLSHKASGPLGAAYDRAQYLAERREMMQAWADYLGALQRSADIVPFARKA